MQLFPLRDRQTRFTFSVPFLYIQELPTLTTELELTTLEKIVKVDDIDELDKAIQAHRAEADESTFMSSMRPEFPISPNLPGML
jgi:hypothetical protein